MTISDTWRAKPAGKFLSKGKEKANVVGLEKNDRLKGIWNLTKILDATSSRTVLKVTMRLNMN